MIRTAAIAAASLAALAAAAPAASAAQPAADLYVATANKGNLAPTHTPGVYKLTLAQPSPARPSPRSPTGRRAPPRPSRSASSDAPETLDVNTFELSRPRIDKHGRAVFRAKRIGPPSGGALEQFGKRADKPSPRRFGRASLFVDAGSLPQSPVQVQVSGLAPGQTVHLQFDQVVDLAKQVTSVRVTDGSAAYVDGGSLTVVALPGKLTNGLYDIALDGTSASGTATIPAGASVFVSIDGGPAQPIANGAFNVG